MRKGEDIMLGTFGFSYVGLVFLLMLFIPNILWARHQPEGYAQLAKNENRVLLVFERVGQALVTCCALVLSDFNINGITPWSIWLMFAIALMLLYEAAWMRYFRASNLKTFYGSMLGIPCPLATLPVIAFLLLGIYGKVPLMIISVILLGIGHIGIHAMHYKTITKGYAVNRP